MSDPLIMNGRLSVVEIVGPAGAGKTMLTLALKRRCSHVQAVSSFRRAGYLLPFARCTLLLLPTFLRQPLYGKRFTCRDMRMMIHLRALLDFLEHGDPLDDTITVFDQGPVYMLARLHESGFQSVKDRWLQGWWCTTLEDWASALDAIVVLDAPDVTLLERIRRRNKPHFVKEKPGQEARRFLDSFRTSCERVISCLTTAGDPMVLSFNSEREPLDRIVTTILTSIDARSDRN